METWTFSLVFNTGVLSSERRYSVFDFCPECSKRQRSTKWTFDTTSLPDIWWGAYIGLSNIIFVTLFLTDVDFVKSVEIGPYVYFFFRERSLECDSCGKVKTSRVARGCTVKQNPHYFKRFECICDNIMSSDFEDRLTNFIFNFIFSEVWSKW